MEGLDLLIQRSKQGSASERTCSVEERLYQFKIKILTDLVHMLKDPKKFDYNILKTAMDGK